MKSTSRWLAFACACAFALACGGGGGGGTNSAGTPTDPGTPPDPGGTPTDPGGTPTDPKPSVTVKRLADCPVCPLATKMKMIFYRSVPAMVIGGKGYMRIGTDFYAYDPQTDTWAKKHGVISDRTLLFELDGKGYRIGWEQFDQYDPEGDSWAQMTEPPILEMETDFSFVFTSNHKAYVGGAARDSDKRVWEYDPTAGQGGTWSEVTQYPGSAATDQCEFMVNGLAYVGGGRITYSTTESYQDFWAFNPASNAWTRETDLPTDVLGVTGLFTLGDGRGYMLSGGDGVLWSYDPTDHSWSELGVFQELGNLGNSVGGVGIGSKGYVLGTDGSLYSVEVSR